MVAGSVLAQVTKWQSVYVVGKKETLFGIARQFGITMEELAEANPEITRPNYKLKKGSTLFIPYHREKAQEVQTPAPVALPQEAQTTEASDVRHRAIRLGVMLPLHDKNGDGRRMVEYYRGVLMACDSLKKQGLSVDVTAWNAAEDVDISTILSDPKAARQDLIIGPLYSRQVQKLSDFCQQHHQLLVIPFSINAPQLYTNRSIFQVYQTQTEQTEATVRQFAQQFKDCHPVIVDCADTASTKGTFTAALRRELEVRGIDYSLTSLSSSTANFVNAFSKTKRNVVVLNSSRQQLLTSAFGKLSAVTLMEPSAQISVFGYTEWLIYASNHIDNFYKYDVYIPSTFYTNMLSSATSRLMQKYRFNFHQEMMATFPRFALTGFDHAYFFLKGLNKYGMEFDGAAGRFGYPPVQTPLRFERVGVGGFQNRTHLFVHYTPEHRVMVENK